MWDWIQNHILAFWEALLGILLVIGGFLLSKKAILGTTYYTIKLLKMAKTSLQQVGSKKARVLKKPLPKEFWVKAHLFQEVLARGQKEKKEEFRLWLESLLREGVLSPSDLSGESLYRAFARYQLLETPMQKEQFAQELAEELKRAAGSSE